MRYSLKLFVEIFVTHRDGHTLYVYYVKKEKKQMHLAVRRAATKTKELRTNNVVLSFLSFTEYAQDSRYGQHDNVCVIVFFVIECRKLQKTMSTVFNLVSRLLLLCFD